MYQVIVGYFDDAKANLLQALDFMKAINDYKYIGTVYRYLGLVELNTQNWKTAQEFFIKALEFQKKAEFIQSTQAGVKESHPHEVKITKEAPNYQISDTK